MVGLSAHSQCARVLYSSRSGSLCSSTKAAGALCFSRDRRVRRSGRRLSIECNLQGKLCDGVECAGRDIRLQCSRVAAAEALPLSLEDLKERFGQPGVKFVEAAGYRILEMRLNEGSSARIVLQSARVASYKSRMWHGGVEELLHTLVVPGMDESQRPAMVGGVALRVWEAEAGMESNLASAECWDVENVRSNPAEFVQVTLSTTSKGSSAGHNLQFTYVVTLTEAALACAVITTNIGNTAVNIHGSLQTSIAVNFVDGTYALGLQGLKYLSTPPNSSVQDTKIGEGIFSKLQWFSGTVNDKKKKKEDISIETDDEDIVEEEFVRMKGGFDRLYTVAPDCMSLLDRGKRRTVIFHETGFKEIRLSNPGEESGLEDWDSFVCVELARSSQPVHLQPGQEWRVAQQLENPSK